MQILLTNSSNVPVNVMTQMYSKICEYLPSGAQMDFNFNPKRTQGKSMKETFAEAIENNKHYDVILYYYRPEVSGSITLIPRNSFRQSATYSLPRLKDKLDELNRKPYIYLINKIKSTLSVGIDNFQGKAWLLYLSYFLFNYKVNGKSILNTFFDDLETSNKINNFAVIKIINIGYTAYIFSNLLIPKNTKLGAEEYLKANDIWKRFVDNAPFGGLYNVREEDKDAIKKYINSFIYNEKNVQ